MKRRGLRGVTLLHWRKRLDRELEAIDQRRRSPTIVELLPGGTCARPRVVLFLEEHHFVMEKKGRGHIAVCKHCGAMLKKGKRR